MTAKEIRQSFKDFFESKGHKIVPSAPMVVKGDPTLMFTNAGMNQFKDIILGNVRAKYHRVADSQKCLRVSGKHNDLEEVGHDTYHHTMFAMLGNWSFGDYFKEGAIDLAWEYLTEIIKIDKKRLYVTVFEGKNDEGLAKDTEAYDFWKKHLPENRILNGNKKDNFWEMGETGPCGPCSEIHIDIRSEKEREKIPGNQLVNKGNPQVIEIWNLVFMQYNRKADGSLENLPAHVIDTGMGFERLCMALQGKTSNYDTDVFQPIIQSINKISGYKYGTDKEKDIATRVIADHIRTIAFSITDGQLPSNAKAGYVIRRILRRAVRYGYTFLGMSQPFLYKLLPALIETMGDAYPELILQRNLIEKVIKEEEDSFLKTLETGIKLLEKAIEETKDKKQSHISGKDAFTLYDTYGFPLDLTELILKENGLSVDEKGYDKEMQKQKERARNAASVETGDWIILKRGDSLFVGYDCMEHECQILKYRKIRQKDKEYFEIVLDRTPFYAEMGGQVGDTGKLISKKGEITEIFDTKRENNLAIHLSTELPSEPGDSFRAVINKERRLAIECNHTATHLLHKALREVLGNHVEQRGSYVSPDNLRFDFSHFKKMSNEEILKVEKIVNKMIREDLKLEEKRNVPIKEAKKMGAMALFGEKYGEEVRVIKYGDSIELCGGTHIPSTGKIGSFKITVESSIAAGVRRIEAVTAESSENYCHSLENTINSIKSLLNNAPDITLAVKKIIEENSGLKLKIGNYLKEKTALLKAKVVENRENLNGISLFTIKGEISTEIVKDIAFQVIAEYNTDSIVAGATSCEGKASLLLMASKNLAVERAFNASLIIKEAAKDINGGGGGQAHFATAGGKKVSGLETAYKKMVDFINKQVS